MKPVNTNKASKRGEDRGGRFKVVEKGDHNAIHCYTYSEERGQDWIEKYGDSKMFTDKTLTKDSFEVIEA